MLRIWSQMAWQIGHPLSQTIFTSLYIDHLFSIAPVNIESLCGASSPNDSPFLEILKTYCVGMIKTCWHVNNRVKSEHFYEVCPLLKQKLYAVL